MQTKVLKALLNYPYISNAKKRILKKQIEIMQNKKEYKTCDRCSFDITDEYGNILEHYCEDDELYISE